MLSFSFVNWYLGRAYWKTFTFYDRPYIFPTFTISQISRTIDTCPSIVHDIFVYPFNDSVLSRSLYLINS